MQNFEIVIPFDGFYESYATSFIDYHIEYMDDDSDTIHDYKIDHKGIAKAYTAAFEQYLLNEHDINISLKFKELVSPKFYNFETDKIYCEIDHKSLVKLIKNFIENTDKEDVKAIFSNMFDSRGGFISFYSELSENCEKILYNDSLLCEDYLTENFDYNSLSVFFEHLKGIGGYFDYSAIYENLEFREFIEVVE